MAWIVRFRFVPVLIIALLVAVSGRAQPVRSQTHAPLDVNIIIADRGNNRIIELTPDKQIVWQFEFSALLPHHGADDAFFAPGNQQIVANLADENQIVLIDYATRKIVWQYGTGAKGSDPGQLHSPDDAYRLPDGNFSVADINSCRVVIISPDKQVVREYGQADKCVSQPGYYNKPNGATPLPDGHFLITEIIEKRITEIDRDGNELWTFHAPVHYPSDAQMTKRGTIILADYDKYGSVLELDKQGNVLWQFGPYDTPEGRLRWPSLAAELPNGNIIVTDDFNHRVIIIDKDTKQIVWQYGVTGRKGDLPGYLDIPDGLDWRHNADEVVNAGNSTATP